MSASGRFIRLFVLIAFLAGFMVLPQMSRAAGPWYVAPGGSDSNSCLSPAAPCASINGAIGKASPGDTIYIQEATYTGSGDNVVFVNKDISLSGGWDETFTTSTGKSVIDGQVLRRGISIEPQVSATFERLDIRNGSTGNGGGGISMAGASLVMNNSYVHNNYAYAGGGGIFIGSYSTVKIKNSAIIGNYSPQWAGGIYSDYSTVVLENSTLSKNRTDSGGGGVANSGLVGSLALYNVTISSNLADQGGGVWGTGISISNTLIANNTSVSTGPDCQGTITSYGYNLLGNSTGCDIGSSTGDLLDVDPGFGVLVEALGIQTLLPDSTAVDGGNPAGCIGSEGLLATDQRGAARVGVCDIGSYENTPPGPPNHILTYSGSPQNAKLLSAFPLPFQAVVLDDIFTPVKDVPVSFSAPITGPSGVFSDTRTITITVLTDASGLATSPPFIANDTLGTYLVVATMDGISETALFSLENMIWTAWYVSTTGNDGNNCQKTSPCATINAVIQKATSGDTIYVGSGVYSSNSGSEVVLVDKSVVLSGGWDNTFSSQSTASIIDGQGFSRGITINTAQRSTIEYFVIRNGRSTMGGGILNRGNLTLRRSQVSGNLANELGGGLRNDFDAELTISNTIISDNSAGEGGGIFNNGTMTITNSTINNNISTRSGAGISNDEGTSAILTNSTISGNQAGDRGGGIFNRGGVSINNNTISMNKAGALNVNNCILPMCSGGGVYNQVGTIVLLNSLIGGNSALQAPDCGGAGSYDSFGYNLVEDTSDCGFTPRPGDIVNKDPLISTVLTGSPGVHALLRFSPAIDAGNIIACTDHNGVPLPTDQRGMPRYNRCDIGSYEVQPLESASYMTAIPPKANRGETVEIVIRLSNPINSDYPNISVTDTLTDTLTFIDGSLSATSGSPSQQNGVITWNGHLNMRENVFISFKARVSGAAPIYGKIANSATIDGGTEIFTRTVLIDVEPYIVNLPLGMSWSCNSFFDDFSNPASGWFAGSDDLGSSGYLEGEYQVLTKSDQYIYGFNAPTCNFRDYSVEVDARWVGTTGYAYGLTFEVIGEFDEYYLFDVNSDEQGFTLLHRSPSGWITILPWTFSDAILTGTSSNHLKIYRRGAQITLEVNGVILGTWDGITQARLGGMGFAVQSYKDEPNTETRFDNFRVTSSPGAALAASGITASPFALLPNFRLGAFPAFIQEVWREPAHH